MNDHENGKDRNVYDVMNDVNVDIETMDMSDEEKDACVKRLRHKVKARETGRNHGWKTAAAAVAAVLILSGGGLTYAAENGSLAWFFRQSEQGDRKCYSIKICGRELHKLTSIRAV